MNEEERPDLYRLGAQDTLEVKLDPRGLWSATVRRAGKPLHVILGNSVQGVIEASQVELEKQGVELCLVFLRVMVVDLADYEVDQGKLIPLLGSEPLTHLEVALGRWQALPALPRWEWFVDLDQQILAKFERLAGTPNLLHEGIRWHLRRLEEYEHDLRSEEEKPDEETGEDLH